jgi:hypothetical protein
MSGYAAVVSWNFKHIVNHKIMQGIETITALGGRSDLLIYTLSALLKGDAENE